MNDEQATPQDVADLLAREFGPFDLDPAATAENAKAPVFCTVEDDGLAQPWKGRVWLNPPYSRGQIARWLAKAAAETASGNAELVVCLVPAAPETRWWREAMAARPLVRFWPRRIAFGGAESGAKFPQRRPGVWDADGAARHQARLVCRAGLRGAVLASPVGCPDVF